MTNFIEVKRNLIHKKKCRCIEIVKHFDNNVDIEISILLKLITSSPLEKLPTNARNTQHVNYFLQNTMHFENKR